MPKEWKVLDWPDSCAHCGDGFEVYTDHKNEGYAYDGDEVRCLSCRMPGYVSADGESAYIQWHEEPDCDCEWCKAHPVE